MAISDLISRERALDDMLFAMAGTGYQSKAMDVIKFCPAVEQESKWISVKDRLPPPATERYLVTCVFPNGDRIIKTVVWAWNENDEQGDWITWEVVTHWMPMPEPPKEECVND